MSLTHQPTQRELVAPIAPSFLVNEEQNARAQRMFTLTYTQQLRWVTTYCSIVTPTLGPKAQINYVMALWLAGAATYSVYEKPSRDAINNAISCGFDTALSKMELSYRDIDLDGWMESHCYMAVEFDQPECLVILLELLAGKPALTARCVANVSRLLLSKKPIRSSQKMLTMLRAAPFSFDEETLETARLAAAITDNNVALFRELAEEHPIASLFVAEADNVSFPELPLDNSRFRRALTTDNNTVLQTVLNLPPTKITFDQDVMIRMLNIAPYITRQWVLDILFTDNKAVTGLTDIDYNRLALANFRIILRVGLPALTGADVVRYLKALDEQPVMKLSHARWLLILLQEIVNLRSPPAYISYVLAHTTPNVNTIVQLYLLHLRYFFALGVKEVSPIRVTLRSTCQCDGNNVFLIRLDGLNRTPHLELVGQVRAYPGRTVASLPLYDDDYTIETDMTDGAWIGRTIR